MPKKSSAKGQSRYSEPILSIAAGDGILSCAGDLIGHVGRALEHALGEPGRAGDGWWLPVEWTSLPWPVAPDTRLPAHLIEISADLFHGILSEAGLPDWPLAVHGEPDSDPAGQVAASRLDYDAALTASVRDQMIRARRGQGLFRFRVFQIESACRLTGIANPDLLIASHIKPWRLCATTHERLDGANGLLLTPHVDRLFDRGLIGFSDEGVVLLSPALAAGDIRRLGLVEACARNVGTFSERQRLYLAWHREAVFDRAGC
jgi:putative restriction endonuclease